MSLEHRCSQPRPEKSWVILRTMGTGEEQNGLPDRSGFEMVCIVYDVNNLPYTETDRIKVYIENKHNSAGSKADKELTTEGQLT